LSENSNKSKESKAAIFWNFLNTVKGDRLDLSYEEAYFSIADESKPEYKHGINNFIIVIKNNNTLKSYITINYDDFFEENTLCCGKLSSPFLLSSTNLGPKFNIKAICIELDKGDLIKVLDCVLKNFSKLSKLDILYREKQQGWIQLTFTDWRPEHLKLNNNSLIPSSNCSLNAVFLRDLLVSKKLLPTNCHTSRKQ
jgi:hypothetical protein